MNAKEINHSTFIGPRAQVVFLLGPSSIGKTTVLQSAIKNNKHIIPLHLDDIITEFQQDLINHYYAKQPVIAGELTSLLKHQVEHLSQLFSRDTGHKSLDEKSIHEFSKLFEDNRENLQAFITRKILAALSQQRTIVIDLVSYDDYLMAIRTLQKNEQDITVNHLFLYLPFEQYLERVSDRNKKAINSQRYNEVRFRNMPASQYFDFLDVSAPATELAQLAQDNIQSVFNRFMTQQENLFRPLLNNKKAWDTFCEEQKQVEKIFNTDLKDFFSDRKTVMAGTKEMIDNIMNINGKSPDIIASQLAYLCTTNTK
ncbi:MAG: hypothetical protein PVG20_05505 [Thioalkalispiraceae bacterium]|jgi:hypothetical protein